MVPHYPWETSPETQKASSVLSWRRLNIGEFVKCYLGYLALFQHPPAL